jgi:ubiquinone/menaquinone biosynthesis C-methylase UbiE
MNIQDKYSQAEVVAFWTQFAETGLQAAEAWMLAQYAPSLPARILDLGCGAGRVTLALAPQGYEVVGLDITAAMVQAAHTLTAQKNLHGDFVQADLTQLPLTNDSFEVALIFIAAIQHIEGRAQRQAALRQIARILKDDGVLILALDNVAPALRCYVSWAWQRVAGGKPKELREIKGDKSRYRSSQLSMLKHRFAAANYQLHSSADSVLAANRSRMSGVWWHMRGLLRALRWRTWEGVRDRLRALRVMDGERGDTLIEQVSMPPTEGKVYYHLYGHGELIEDVRMAGLQLLSYHSARELAEGKRFGESARCLDKQVMYAFRKISD